LFALALSLLQWIINLCWSSAREDAFRHNPQYTAQYNNYLKHRDTTNVVFIGSSRTYRQIDPEIIDSVLASNHVNSYNLGAHATFIPEQFYLFDHFLQAQPDPSPVKHVYMELTGINAIKLSNWFAPQSYYYLDWNMVKFVCNTHFSNKDLSPVLAFALSYPYIQGFIFKHIVPLQWMTSDALADNYSGESGNGYYALDRNLEQSPSENLQSRRDEFLSDTSVLVKREKKQVNRKVEQIPEPYLAKLHQMVDQARSKGIELYFIIPPKLKYYSSLATMKTDPIWERVIDMGDYKENRDLYLARYNFDDGHFNSTGAAIYTARLAQAMSAHFTTPQVEPNATY
jgi:hypothetical protein